MDEDYEISVNSNVLTFKPLPSKSAKQQNSNDLIASNQNTHNNLSFKSNRDIANAIVRSNGCSSSGNSAIASSIIQTAHTNTILTNGTLTTTAIDFDNKIIFSAAAHTNNAATANNTATAKLGSNLRATIVASAPISCYDDSIDNGLVKEEPMSPNSSCPPSPNTTGVIGSTGHTIIVTQPQPTATTPYNTINMNLSNVATYASADLFFEHNKVRILWFV